MAASLRRLMVLVPVCVRHTVPIVRTHKCFSELFALSLASRGRSFLQMESTPRFMLS